MGNLGALWVGVVVGDHGRVREPRVLRHVFVDETKQQGYVVAAEVVSRGRWSRYGWCRPGRLTGSCLSSLEVRHRTAPCAAPSPGRSPDEGYGTRRCLPSQ